MFPLGISESEGAVVGVEQRVGRSGSNAQLPGSDPAPSGVAILPCVLRRALSEGELGEAVRLARASQVWCFCQVLSHVALFPNQPDDVLLFWQPVGP